MNQSDAYGSSCSGESRRCAMLLNIGSIEQVLLKTHFFDCLHEQYPHRAKTDQRVSMIIGSSLAFEGAACCRVRMRSRCRSSAAVAAVGCWHVHPISSGDCALQPLEKCAERLLENR